MVIIGNSCTGDDIGTEENMPYSASVGRKRPEVPEGREGLKQLMAYYGTYSELTFEDFKCITTKSKQIKE